MARRTKTTSDPRQNKTSIEISMVNKSEFDDELLERCLYQGEIKASEKMERPPQVLWVDECVISTFGNFSATKRIVAASFSFLASSFLNG